MPDTCEALGSILDIENKQTSKKASKQAGKQVETMLKESEEKQFILNTSLWK